VLVTDLPPLLLLAVADDNHPRRTEFALLAHRIFLLIDF
jgi:hypothetical protein